MRNSGRLKDDRIGPGSAYANSAIQPRQPDLSSSFRSGDSDNAARSQARTGSLLSRKWNGKLERVMVLENGFPWNGETYASRRRSPSDDRHKLEWPSFLRLANGKT
jgi:hypothetical protein